MQPTINKFTQDCSAARTNIKAIGKQVLELKNFTVGMTELTQVSDKGEMIANVTLAYRHLEDAAMRLGKAIQAYETGNSIYDQNDSMRAAGMQQGASLLPNQKSGPEDIDITDPKLVYYGPHPCEKCDPKGTKGTLIVKAGNGAPDSLEFDYPVEAEEKNTKGYAYPNTTVGYIWKKHEHVA